MQQTSTAMRGGYFSYESHSIASMQLPALGLQHPADQQRHAAVVTLVEQLTAGYATLCGLTLPTAREQAQVRLRHLKQRLDALGYTLYGPTDAEITHLTLPAG